MNKPNGHLLIIPQQVCQFQARLEMEPATAAPKLKFDEAVIRRLHDLGYVE